MITQWLFAAIGALVRALLDPLPDWDLGDLGIEGFGAIAGITGRILDQWFPIDTLVICLGILLGCHIALGIWNLCFFVYHQIWGSS